MSATPVALRRCALAVLLFLASVIPFQQLCAGPYAEVILAAGSWLSDVVGPAREGRMGAEGTLYEIDRRGMLRQFFTDPEQRPRAYSVLAVWSWLAVVPLLTLRRRLRLACGATLTLAGTYSVALTCRALVWYQESLAAQVGSGAETSGIRIAILDAFGSVLLIAALFALPLVLAMAAYPGLEPAGGRKARSTA